MLTEVEIMEISILRKQGKSLRSISKSTGKSINTVRKYAAGDKKSEYKDRPVVPKKLDPHKDYIRQRLSMAAPFPGTAGLAEQREFISAGTHARRREAQYSAKIMAAFGSPWCAGPGL